MSRERGQATVELALLLPVVVLLLGLIGSVGSSAGDRLRLQHAAREAARVAAVTADLPAIRRTVTDLGIDDVELVVRPAAHERIQGRPVTVELEWQPPGLAGWFGAYLLDDPLRARSAMRIEQP